MARKQPRSQNEQPSGEPQEASDESGSFGESDTATGKPISKSAAARAALAEGFDTPGAAVAFIKSRYGIDMGAQHFSAVKSQFKKSQRGSGPSGRKPAPIPAGAGGDAGPLDALEGVKELVDQYGAERVKRMVDLLGKSR